MKKLNAINLYVEADHDGEYVVSLEYIDSNDDCKEYPLVEKYYKTLKTACKNAKKYADKYSLQVNLL